jgi:AcrR family transcriptional regulator
VWKNRILVVENAIPASASDSDNHGDVAARVAAQTLSKRGADYTAEVRRLLDAALEVIAAQGTASRARVADIVAAAGLSNEAFYRHFPSKNALVAALLEDGTERLASYVSHQMDKESKPADKVRRWVEGVLSQSQGQTAATTLAVLLNGSTLDTGTTSGTHDSSAPLAALVVEPLTALGSSNPELDASLVAHATLGRVADHLWAGRQPSRDEIDHITRFALGTATAGTSKP